MPKIYKYYTENGDTYHYQTYNSHQYNKHCCDIELSCPAKFLLCNSLYLYKLLSAGRKVDQIKNYIEYTPVYYIQVDQIKYYIDF